MQSLNLVEGSDSPSGADRGSDLERRRLPRIALTQEQFRLQETGKVFSVSDLSPGGMAIRVIDENDLILLAVGSEVAGVLNLRREKMPVRGRVRHLVGDRVGIAFEKLEKSTEETLSKFLDPRILGADLRPMPTSEAVAGLWFHGSSGTDLWLERSVDGGVRQFLLLMLGCFVRWKAVSGVSSSEAVGPESVQEGGQEGGQAGEISTGLVDAGPMDHPRESDEARGVIRWETHWLKMDSRLDIEKLSLGVQILEAAPLAEDLRRAMIRKLRRRSG